MLKISSSTCFITPLKKTTLGCNGAIRKVYNDIDSNIEINAIRLQQASTDVFIISVDTLFVTDNIKQLVIDFLKPKINLTEAHVFVCASHTHYAPYLDDTKPHLGNVDTEYYNYFKRQLESLLDALVTKECVDVELVYKEVAVSDVAVSRRKYAWGFWKRLFLRKSMRIHPNPDQPIDNKLRLMQWVTKESKKPVAVMWNFACHPVIYHAPNNLSAHFIGDVRNNLRKQLSDVPVVFFQGFSGDVRPYNVGEHQSIKGKIVSWLNKAPEFCVFTKKTYEAWVHKINTAVEGCLNQQPADHYVVALDVALCSVRLNEIKGADLDQTIVFHAIHLTDSLVILGVSAEVVSEYSLELQRLYPNKTIVPVGCLGAVFGYWPTKKMINEGGYEVEGFHKGFSIKGQFKTTLEDTFYDSAKAVIQN
jgi:neutral ceramidase